MSVKFIKTAEKKKIAQRLVKLYDVKLPDCELLELNKNQIRIFSGTLNKSRIRELSKVTKIDSIGLHVIDNEQGDLKLTFDSLNVLEPERPWVEINSGQLDQWLKGHDIEAVSSKGSLILEYRGDLVGMAKSTGNKIFNSVPKDRKIKTAIR